eukprot:jgi/Pico_ML_1/53871/g4340.t1
MQVKRAAYYNQCCCHTYFGDLELAQFALRDAILCGLDYAQAQEDPTLLRMEASAQAVLLLPIGAGPISKAPVGSHCHQLPSEAALTNLLPSLDKQISLIEPWCSFRLASSFR